MAVSYPDYLRTGYVRGWVLPTNAFVRGESSSSGKIDEYQSGFMELGWQTTGEEPWQRAYNLPSYGIGLQGGGFNDNGQIGQPVSGYMFFIYPIKRWGKWTINTNWKVGLAGHWHTFDDVDNPNNIAISAPVTLLLDLGGTLDYSITDNLALGFGATYTHFSDGGSKQPNQGLNSASPLVQLTYNFQERPAIPKQILPPYTPNWEVDLQGWGGWTNLGTTHLESAPTTSFPTHNFPAAGITALLNRQISWKSKVGAGLDIDYDDSHTKEIAQDGTVTDLAPSFWDKMSLGPVGGYEQVIGRFSVIVQIGYAALRKSIPDQTPNLYQRVGFKYHFCKDAFLGLNVRIHDFQKTQHLEFTIGRRWVI